MPKLTVERLFGNPPLAGTLPTRLRFAPDSSYLAWLQTAGDDRERLDLWRMDLASGERECWVDARDLHPEDGPLSNAEKAERERRRQFASGITNYQISKDGVWLLLPIAGRGYLLEIATATVHAFTPDNTRQTDFQFSPDGNFVSYVREGNLYYRPVSGGAEVAVSSDGGALVSNGIADFIAQEEMHRFQGHWWSADESRIAFCRTDEASVAVSRRFEIDADELNVVEQRYPYAGTGNASVDLRVYELDGGRISDVDYRHHPDDYLARVDWAGERLAVQVQSRDQQHLRLCFHNLDLGTRITRLHEQSDTWINLHDNFTMLADGRFLWTSERSGTNRIYLYGSEDADDEPALLSADHGRVGAILHADGEQVFYTGWQETPTEMHLFRTRLDGAGPVQITGEPGWHDPVSDVHGALFADRFTSLTCMGEIRIIDATGRDAAIRPAALDEDVHHPYHPYLTDHVTPQLGVLTAEDGQTLHYRLTPPAERTGRHPLIVCVYGGPGAQRVRNEWAPLLLQLFARHGFGVLELDNRGSANREPAFEAPIHGRLGEVEVRDQVLGVRFATSLPWVDESRIGVFGHSYGGYMTILCLARAAHVFRAGVAVAPVSDWRLYDTHYTERYLGNPAEHPQRYRDSSVFPYLPGIQGRLLIMHGMADDNVLFTHSTRLFKALQDRCQPFEMMTYPGAKHALQEHNVSVHRFNMILSFFRRTFAT